MASNINPNNIDGTYPVAGQDNDSQGFRDNFTNTSNNFSTAASEIGELQSTALLISALTTVPGSGTNNMGGASIQSVALNGASYTLNNQGTLSGTALLDFSTGNMQEITTGGSLTVSFASTWPVAGQFANMILWLNVTSTLHTITLPITSPGVTIGLDQIAGANTTTGVITFDQAGTYLLSFTTLTAGSTILITDLTRNFVSLRGTNLYTNPSISSTIFAGYSTAGLPIAVAYDSGQNAITTFGSYSSASVGNLSLANIIDGTNDTGTTSGYTIVASRGNLTTATISPVLSNDYLGYRNAVAYTGNAAGNVFQQVSSIAHFATGSNVTYGLGGNIAFYTKKDGVGTGTNMVYQAMGIENDQTVKHFGNVILASTGVPAHNSSTGVAGQIAWDSGYLYVCTTTNTWVRVALNLTSW